MEVLENEYFPSLYELTTGLHSGFANVDVPHLCCGRVSHKLFVDIADTSCVI